MSWVRTGRTSCKSLRSPLAKVGLEAFLPFWGPGSAVNIPLYHGVEGLTGIVHLQGSLPFHPGAGATPTTCVVDGTYTAHAHSALITLPEGLLSKNYFPVSRRHALATSTRLLSCTDGPHLSGRQHEAIPGWFGAFQIL